jgi:hypothetical protein
VRLRVALSILVATSVTFAQPTKKPLPPTKKPVTVLPRRPPPIPKPKTKPTRRVPLAKKPGGLKFHLGLASAQRMLKSSTKDDRVRGIERLGGVGTAPALELLVKSIEPNGAAKSFEERLTAVRALASHTDKPEVRQALARAMAGSSGSKVEEAGEEMVQKSAALALARSGHKDSIELLGKALRQEGPVAEAAAEALVAHPPKDLSALLRARGAPTPVLVSLFDRLGDQRSFEVLRGFVKYGSTDIRALAAVALTRHGDLETVPLARRWLEREKNEPTLRRAAAEILTLTGAPDAPKAVKGLLAAHASAVDGLDLALAGAHPDLVPALAKGLAKADAASAPAYLAAIGRAGGPEAVKLLASELTHADRGAAAAHALALSSGNLARDAIERALAQPATKKNAARAAVIRATALGQRVSGLDAALNELIVSADKAERAAGAWGHAVLSTARAKKLLARKDPVVVRAAARAAFDPELARFAGELLAREKSSLTRQALASALAHKAGADRVPTETLSMLIEDGGAAAPLAALALGARDSLSERPQIELLLKSGDALVRAHVALGLGSSHETSAVGLLANAYRFESVADARYAVIVALSQRKESARIRTLTLAARLDGDARVRQAARTALTGARLSALPMGSGTFWLTLVESDGKGSEGRAATVGVSGGAALPVVADPDGAVTLAGLPKGPVSLRLAPAADESINARSR